MVTSLSAVLEFSRAPKDCEVTEEKGKKKKSRLFRKNTAKKKR